MILIVHRLFWVVRTKKRAVENRRALEEPRLKVSVQSLTFSTALYR
jgi:hypothetical protein